MMFDRDQSLKQIDIKQSIFDMRKVKDKMNDEQFANWYSHKFYASTKLRPGEILAVLRQKNSVRT